MKTAIEMKALKSINVDVNTTMLTTVMIDQRPRQNQ